MTTTDPNPLQERVAEELYYEQHPEGRQRSEWPAAVHPDTVYEYRDLAAAVLPIIAAEVRKAQPETLRGAAETILSRRQKVSYRTINEYADELKKENSGRDLRPRGQHSAMARRSRLLR